jgi:[methyl-Co(III) methanol-specific corrinoid protein]:coenzyme M methyltransferase
LISITPRDRVLGALRGEKTDRIPVSCMTQLGLVEAMEITGARWPEAHHDAAKMATLGSSLYKLTGLEAARIPFCLTVQAENFGCQVEFGSVDQTPGVRKAAYSSVEQVAFPENFLGLNRIPTMLEATRILHKDHPELPVIVGLEGVFTLAGHLMGIENLLKWSIKSRDSISKVLEFTTRANIEYSKALIDAGADVICVADPTASPELLSPRDFAFFIKPKLKEVANMVRSKGALSVLHICGNVARIVKDMAETGFDGLSVEEKIDLAKARELIGSPRPALIGNVAAAKSMFTGKPEDVIQEAKRSLAAGVNILAPGCGMAPRTKLENVRALVSAVGQ